MPGISSAAIVGVDFDNSIISYDRLIREVAMRQGLIDSAVAPDKRAMRDAIRLLPGGETSWQKIQAEIYGPAIAGAELISGVREFFRCCRERGIITHIISHKTEYANYDSTRTDLRQAALGWMAGNGLFTDVDGELDRANVHFAAGRGEKIACIRALQCSHFIDDLIEVFDHPDFPPAVEKLLFDQSLSQSNPSAGIFSSWRDISEHLLGAE